MREARRYAGHADEIIEYATDPWLQWQGINDPIPLSGIALQPDFDNDCGTCGGSPLPGVVPQQMNTQFGIERCDECERFDGDFSASQALAQFIERAHPTLPKVEVWYYPND